MLPPTTNIREAYKQGTNDEQNFLQNLSLFLCTFLKEHGALIEKRKDCHDALLEVSWHSWRSRRFKLASHTNACLLVPVTCNEVSLTGVYCAWYSPSGSSMWVLMEISVSWPFTHWGCVSHLGWSLPPTRIWIICRMSCPLFIYLKDQVFP